MSKVLVWSSGILLGFAVLLFVAGVRLVAFPANRAVASGLALPEGAVAVGLVPPPPIPVDLGPIRTGVRTHFEVKLTNVSSRTARVVGTPGICVRAGCVVVDDSPATILPQQTVTFQLICDPKAIGPFRLTTMIYLDFGDRTGVSVPITVQASVSDSPVTSS